MTLCPRAFGLRDGDAESSPGSPPMFRDTARDSITQRCLGRNPLASDGDVQREPRLRPLAFSGEFRSCLFAKLAK